jgi:hypothetical protein
MLIPAWHSVRSLPGLFAFSPRELISAAPLQHVCLSLCFIRARECGGRASERASERGIHFAAAARMQIYPHQNLLTRNFASGKERKKEKAAAGKRKDSKMRRGEREGASAHTHTHTLAPHMWRWRSIQPL